MDSQTQLSDAELAEMRAFVSPYALRNAYVPEANGTGFLDKWHAHTKSAREQFEQLPAEKQSEVIRVEQTLAEHNEHELERQKQRDLIDGRSERLRSAGCRLRDADHRRVIENTLEPTGALSAVRGWYNDRREACCTISGGCGTGKTFAAAYAIANHRGESFFVDAEDAIKAFGASFGDQFKLAQTARNTGLLILDDVGSESDASKMVSVLCTLHNSRKSARHQPWLITTNLNQRDFAARYANDRLLSRMQQAVWIGVNDPDFRKGMK